MTQIFKHALRRALLLSTLPVVFISCAPNWPQFRGPEQDMIARGARLPETWDDSTNVLWTAGLDAESWASPVVLVDKVFIATAVPVSIHPPEENKDEAGEGTDESEEPPQDIYRWQVTCLDLKTGKEMWKQVAAEGSPRTGKHRAHNYAGETPVTDGKRLYVYFGMTGVYCYSLKGELLWEKDLGAYPTLNEWGTGSSPVVYDGLLYIQVDNEEQSFLVALDSENGDEVWRVQRDERTSYSTPYIWKNRLRTELVTGGMTARSYDPETGELFWELRLDGHYNIPSPIGDRDYLYLGNPGRGETPGTLFCVRAGSEGNITPENGEPTSSGVLWADLDAPTANPSPLLYEGLLYLVSSRGGEVTCINAFNGERIYQEKLEGVAACWASPWANDGRVFFTDEKGTTRVIQAGKNFKLLHENTLSDKFWASMAAAGNKYVFRGSEKVYCIAD